MIFRSHYGCAIISSQKLRLPYNWAIFRRLCLSDTRHSRSNSVSATERELPLSLQSAGWKSREDKRRNTARDTNIDTKNIFADDLAATLEAHRAENRARVVRKVCSDVDKRSFGVYRPLIRNPGQQTSEGVAAEQTISVLRPDDESPLLNVTKVDLSENQGAVLKERKTKRGQSWPTNSLQYKDAKGKRNKIKPDQPLEYEGKNLKPCDQWARNVLQPPTTSAGIRLQAPWLAKMPHKFNSTSLGRLGAEIRAFESYMHLKRSELKAFAFVKAEVLAIVKNTLPHAVLTTIGSYSTDLETPTSDIDFRLIIPELDKKPLSRGPSPGRPEARKTYTRAFYKLQNAFARSDSFKQSEIIYGAVKIIDTIHRDTNLEIDIQFSSSEVSSHMYKEMYLKEFCTLRPLYILLKAALEIRGLKTTFEGGLGSYSIFMMIVYALKTCPPNIHSGDCANQLLHVLQLYSDADLYNQCFSVDPPIVFPKSGILGNRDDQHLYDGSINRIRKIKQQQPYLLCLQDPADPNNDLGKKAYAIKHVQKVFGCARREIKQALRDFSAATGDSDKAMLDSLVGANYESFEADRMRIHRFVTASEFVRKPNITQEGNRKARFSAENDESCRLTPQGHLDEANPVLHPR